MNRKSKGKYITGYIELLEGYDVEQFEIDTVALILNGDTLIPAEVKKSKITDYNKNGIPDLTVKFDRQLVLESIGTGVVQVAITGGNYWVYVQGTDTIRVKN